MPNSIQRLVDAPDANLLTEDEVARYFRFSTETLKRLIARGEFPEPLRNSDRGNVWPWKDVLWYSLQMEVRSRLKVPKAHKGTGAGQDGTTNERDNLED